MVSTEKLHRICGSEVTHFTEILHQSELEKVFFFSARSFFVGDVTNSKKSYLKKNS